MITAPPRTETGKIGQPQNVIQFPSISPDGQRVAALGYQEDDNGDVWIHDVRRPIKTRLTFAPGRDYSVRWSPTSNEIIFNSARGGDAALFITSADGSSEAKELFDTPGKQENPHDWSRDGRFLILHIVDPDSARDLWYLERKDDGSWSDPVEFLKTPFEERVAVFSPDTRFVAYVSDESGRDEVYVRPFPPGDNLSKFLDAANPAEVQLLSEIVYQWDNHCGGHEDLDAGTSDFLEEVVIGVLGCSPAAPASAFPAVSEFAIVSLESLLSFSERSLSHFVAVSA